LQWQDGGRADVQVVVDVPRRELLRPGEPGAPDRLTITATLRDQSGDVLASHAWQTELPAAEAAIPMDVRQSKRLTIPQPGTVSLELGILVRGRILLTDWTRHWRIDALPPRTPACSEPVFLNPAVHATGTATDADEVSLSRVFGEHEPVVLRSTVYVPAHSPEASGDSLVVDWQVEAAGTPEASGWIRLHVEPDRVTPFDLRLPRLPPGVHGVRLTVRGAAGDTEVAAGWQIVPQIDTWGDSLPSELVQKIVLPADDFARLQKAPVSQRLQVWKEALQRLMPGPPEAALDVLQQRWSEASARFVEPQRPGWRTDRGRVYIRRGAPDEVEELRDPESQERLERWRYRAANHVYLFRDRTGSGTWVLERTNDPAMR
jgi:GWxTD domain-containing protein